MAEEEMKSISESTVAFFWRYVLPGYTALHAFGRIAMIFVLYFEAPFLMRTNAHLEFIFFTAVLAVSVARMAGYTKPVYWLIWGIGYALLGYILIGVNLIIFVAVGHLFGFDAFHTVEPVVDIFSALGKEIIDFTQTGYRYQVQNY